MEKKLLSGLASGVDKPQNRVIWYISKYASPLRYGFPTRHYYLADEFQRRGDKVLIISSDSNHLGTFPKFAQVYTKESADGIDTWWIKTAKYRQTKSIRRALSWIDFEFKLFFLQRSLQPKPSVVIVSSLSLLTILNGYYLKKKYGCRLLFEIRDIWPLTMTEEDSFRRSHPLVLLLSWVEKFGYNVSDVIVGTMPNIAAHVSHIAPGADSKCAFVPFGYDPQLLALHEELPIGYEAIYIPKNKFIVGYAGSIGRTNALEILVACAEKMRAYSTVHFLLIGDGDLLEDLKSRTDGWGNITFAPKVKKKQVQTLLRKCDVLYFSSKNSEVWKYGLSLNKIIDYMLAARPIIGSYSGFPSMINEAQCGTFVPADDIDGLVEAILHYQKMPAQERDTIGEKGRDWLLKNRSYSKLAADYCELFQS